MEIVCKFFKTIKEFKEYVDSVQLTTWKPQFPVIHNTSSPTQAQYESWHSRKGWTQEQWGRNLASYYAGMGWNGYPHLFVCYDGILVLNPLNAHGTHTTSWNNLHMDKLKGN